MAEARKQKFIDEVTAKFNGRFDYSKVNYKNAREKVAIICKQHNVQFLQSPDNHKRYSNGGCPECLKELVSEQKLKPADDFIKQASEIHKEHNYDYSQVVYKTCKDKVIINCREHGPFEMTPDHHINRSQGCPKHRDEYLSTLFRKSTEEFKAQALAKHPDKGYDYKLVEYINRETPVKIICPKHDIFLQTPFHHLRGHGCQKCQLCPTCMIWHTNGRVCEYCKPKSENKKYAKTKEMKVVKFLKEMLPDNEFIHNKSVGSEFTDGHLFPDIMFDCDHYRLIVEVDEHKHRGSGYECEKRRMLDIIAKVKRPCIFIRYNPDSKESNENELLNTVEMYLDMDSRDTAGIWDDFGFKAEYLFY